MKNENTRNTIIFIVCSAQIQGVYLFAVLRPQVQLDGQLQVMHPVAVTQQDVQLAQGVTFTANAVTAPYSTMAMATKP